MSAVNAAECRWHRTLTDAKSISLKTNFLLYILFQRLLVEYNSVTFTPFIMTVSSNYKLEYLYSQQLDTAISLIVRRKYRDTYHDMSIHFNHSTFLSFTCLLVTRCCCLSHWQINIKPYYFRKMSFFLYFFAISVLKVSSLTNHKIK